MGNYYYYSNRIFLFHIKFSLGIFWFSEPRSWENHILRIFHECFTCMFELTVLRKKEEIWKEKQENFLGGKFKIAFHFKLFYEIYGTLDDEIWSHANMNIIRLKLIENNSMELYYIYEIFSLSLPSPFLLNFI